MRRSKIEMYWNGVDTAPAEVPLQVLVNDGSGSDYLLPYPCKRTPNGWVNAATRSPLQVRPTYWKVHVETRQGRKARKSRGPPSNPANNLPFFPAALSSRHVLSLSCRR